MWRWVQHLSWKQLQWLLRSLLLPILQMCFVIGSPVTIAIVIVWKRKNWTCGCDTGFKNGCDVFYESCYSINCKNHTDRSFFCHWYRIKVIPVHKGKSSENIWKGIESRSGFWEIISLGSSRNDVCSGDIFVSINFGCGNGYCWNRYASHNGRRNIKFRYDSFVGNSLLNCTTANNFNFKNKELFFKILLPLRYASTTNHLFWITSSLRF